MSVSQRYCINIYENQTIESQCKFLFQAFLHTKVAKKTYLGIYCIQKPMCIETSTKDLVNWSRNASYWEISGDDFVDKNQGH